MKRDIGSVKEVKNRKTGKSYSPKHWRIVLSYTVPDEENEGETKRLRISENHIGTKKGAYARCDEMIAERDDRGRLLTEVQKLKEHEEAVNATTLTELIEQWDQARRVSGKASERTLRNTRNHLRQIEDHLGNAKVKDITPQMIEATYAAIKEERDIGNTTLHHLHTLLKSVFEKAIDYGLIAKNPCRYVSAPARDDTTRRSLTRAEAQDLLAVVNREEALAYVKLAEQEERRTKRGKTGVRTHLRGLHNISVIMAVRIGIATGMRRGEVFALSWGHVNLQTGALAVLGSQQQDNRIKTTKTHAGLRTIAIDPQTVKHLVEWKERQAIELDKLGIEQDDSTPVCCSDTGGRYSIDNFTHWWARWRVKQGYPDLKFHELRHTQATMLLANYVDVKTVQARLGHANPSITLSCYAHAVPENDHAAADLIGSLFGTMANADAAGTSGFQVIHSQESNGSANDASFSESPSAVPPMSPHGAIRPKTKQARKSA